jgi:hypothetical protein
MATYDLCIVCGRRPELLERTLASFGEKVFAHFSFRSVLANIDPFCGSDADGAEVRRILLRNFPEATLFAPDQPSFGAAVARLWQATTADNVLHLEDDWLALEPITPQDVESRLAGDIGQLVLMSREKNWNGASLYQTRSRKVRVLGVPVWTRRVSRFSTSPCFLSGRFARTSAALMKPDLDPEKQFHDGLNPPLEAFALQHRALFLPGRESPEIIRDIGRAWRDARGISKELVSGASIWKGVSG